MLSLMGDLLKLIWRIFFGLFLSRASLEAEVLTLRHQLNVLQRKASKRVAFNTFDRAVVRDLLRHVRRLRTMFRLSPIRLRE